MRFLSYCPVCGRRIVAESVLVLNQKDAEHATKCDATTAKRAGAKAAADAQPSLFPKE